MKDTVANVYARKSRLKSRIKSAKIVNKELFLNLFGIKRYIIYGNIFLTGKGAFQ